MQRRKTTVETEILVVGGGLAGLFAALCAAETAEVILATEGTLLSSNSYWAQGGVAAAIDEGDAPTLHAADTLRAGGGLNDPAAVQLLAQEAPARIADLLAHGVVFDGDHTGPHLGLEGGHSRRRILHVNGSATGSGIVEALARAVRAHPRITVWEETVAGALVSDDERCGGAVVHDAVAGADRRVFSASTILATGGAGALYARTTNPPAARGAGIALAAAAGAALADMEFMQFHPTALALPGERSFLLSEALRGEGAYLVDRQGRRVMQGRHELAELAPRDVVARAIVEEMHAAGTDHVFLDLRHLEPAGLRARFPNIDAHLRERGLDLTSDLLPVAPAAHYTMGGVATDLWGATTIAGLLACGEVACAGVHGANRLASNSLLECIVFGWRAARAAVAYAARRPAPVAVRRWATVVPSGEPPATALDYLRATLMARAGLVRDGDELRDLHAELVRWEAGPAITPTLRPAVQVAAAIAQSALLRTESRGAHLRADYPAPDPAWATHIVLERAAARIESTLPTTRWLSMDEMVHEADEVDEAQDAVAADGQVRRDVA